MTDPRPLRPPVARLHDKRYRRRLVPGMWVDDDVAASQSGVEMIVYGASGALGAGSRLRVPMVRPGSVTGIVVRSNEARTAGSLTVEPTINGTATGLSAVLDATNTTVHTATQAAGRDTYPAGGEVGVKITTTGDWAPTSADIQVTVEVLD